MFMYALNDVAPSSAQYATWRLTSAGPSSDRICVKLFGPFRYGAVTSMSGPALRPAVINRFRLLSMMKPLTLPPVLIVVTPPARYSRTKLSPSCPYTPGPVG